jgi:O-antigen/teichoic acid export membrane protein
VHNLFWINTFAGGVLCGATFVCAPILAAFYGQPELTSVTRVIGPSFAISGIAVQPMALLQRRMQLGRSTIVELVSPACGAAVAVGFAINGAGYWALVVNGLVSQTVRLILAFFMSGYRPGWPRSDSATTSMLTFGGYLTLSSVVTFLARNTDNILIGREWGAEALGYYSRAYFLMTLPTMLLTNSLARVMVPSLSALAHDRERMAAAYQSAVKTIAFVGFPLAVGLATTAPETVRLVYGEGWQPVVPILSWLSIAMACQVVTSTNSWLYTAVGKGKELLVVGAAATLIYCVAIVVGNRWGPVGVAASYTIAYLVVAVPLLIAAHSIASIPARNTLIQLRPIVAATAAMGSGVVVAGRIATELSDRWMTILATKVLAGSAIFALLAILHLAPWPIAAAERWRHSIVTTSSRRFVTRTLLRR